MPAGERPVDGSASIGVMREGEPGEPAPLGTVLDGLHARDEIEERLLRHGVYAIGPRPDLIGRRVDAPRAQATIDGAGDFDDVAADAPVLPVLVSGDATGLPDGAPIAIAVNGRVAATTRVYPPGQYVALVAPESLRQGANAVHVLDLRKIGGNRSITRP
jgi:hypothetical protein